MTNQQHPITPPLEVMLKLRSQFHNGETLEATWTLAFQAGANQELEACCEWLIGWDTCEGERLASLLREGRRPKPPSLKEQALEVFEALIHGDASGLDVGVIRRALEALPE
jgi:hypothetical protein